MPARAPITSRARGIALRSRPTGRGDRDPVDAVLDEIDERGATRLVIAVRRRSLVSKAVLGSVSQRLILNSPIPVLAVKSD